MVESWRLELIAGRSWGQKLLQETNKVIHYIVIKRSIYQEDITILSIYALDIGTPKYVQQIQTELKGNINTNTVIFSDFNTELST